eukprot:gene28880-37248_t
MITSIASGTLISKIAVGDYHCLLVAAMTGQLFSFGRGNFGELGNGDKFDWVQDPTPVLMPPEESVVSVSAGANFSAVVGSSGALYTFGSGAYFRLGLGTDEDFIIPTRVFALDHVGVTGQFHPQDGRYSNAGMSLCCCGTWHAVALTRDSQEAYVWGWNKFGQCGGDMEEIIAQPQRLEALDDLLEGEGIQAVSCGSRHTAMLTSSGRVLLFGRVGRDMETGTWEGDTALEFGPAAAPRVLPLDGRATGISSALWSLG